jgi:hypothetical protein
LLFHCCLNVFYTYFSSSIFFNTCTLPLAFCLTVLPAIQAFVIHALTYHLFPHLPISFTSTLGENNAAAHMLFCRNSHAPSMHSLGVIYERKAARLHRQAAEAGVVGAKERARALLALSKDSANGGSSAPLGTQHQHRQSTHNSHSGDYSSSGSSGAASRATAVRMLDLVGLGD